MKKFVWLVIGIGIGFALAHEANKTRQGNAFFRDLDQKAREFGEAISDGYRQREAELRAALGGDEAGTAPTGPTL